jgi:hypothetical protein
MTFEELSTEQKTKLIEELAKAIREHGEPGHIYALGTQKTGGTIYFLEGPDSEHKQAAKKAKAERLKAKKTGEKI